MRSLGKIFHLDDESGVLRLSIAITGLIAAFGIGIGLLSGSFSILFDGAYSLIDAGMSLLALAVVRLIHGYTHITSATRRLRERFTVGFWHLEPMALGLNGVLLIGVSAYAFFNAVSLLLDGGRPLEFDLAILYAVITATACTGAAALEMRANRRIRSAFIALDARGWIMSASITLALLAAFCIGSAIEGTAYGWMAPYVDPAVLALVCLIIIPLPMRTVKQALADILLVTPPELKAHVDAVAHDAVRAHGFLSFRAYVAKVGRAQQIELYFIVPADGPPRRIGEWDALRDEIGKAIGPDSPDRWLTIIFTADLEWAE
ncbi:putative Co/Zn/Cd cation transporter (cation efflux family) [Ancylobacter sp. 3268]|uniref:cation diffusion facilitator family transporter n=1 Tax=Ancylobacter sp. 3268 TaxID=2817752 RepID=UPI0028650A8A|nr:cation transporter [Ancylobacter sp. 3268]MDR6952172.1 putative Co/Zn/Cd cation transporter (cation efflux family) [Ancylobacter sp. 3268]